ncbi:MAG TPA: EAL domain-containing protein [Terriglobales bacterium]|nr:EAL domain-containing protein [Terriglobales bacterium]
MITRAGSAFIAVSLILRTRQIDRREWWLWAFAVVVTIALTATIIFLTIFHKEVAETENYWSDLREWVRGLAALVLLFDIYTMYQHRQLLRIRRELADSNELFHLITENAADMIAVVDGKGRRLYNSPAYSTVLGYSPDELGTSLSTEQIHPADRPKVIEAAAKARATGRGERLEYRMRHKDGSWRILESTANLIASSDGNSGSLVIVNRDITDRKRAEELVAHNAFHDGLTGLPNRLLFNDRLRQAMMRARRSKHERVAVLLVDVDEFKVVNDSLGHSAGDQLLVAIAHRLEDCLDRGEPTTIAASDVEVEEKTQGLARFGGDDFIVLFEELSAPADAIRLAQHIQESLAPEFVLGEHRIVVTASIGVALLSSAHIRPEELIRDAELAMYRAKSTGRSRCEVFDPEMHSAAIKRLKLETELRRGMEQGELLAYYQPIISLATGKIAGFEALSRWQRASGMVQPADFIPVAEETGLIVPMNQQLMLDACRQGVIWQDSFGCPSPLFMSMNITPKQFERAQLAEEVRDIMSRTGSTAANIHLEITETVTMQDADAAMNRLSQLKAIGVHLSIDDFGTGFSSLSRLRRFPVDALKIDRVFISSMTEDRDSFEIVRATIALAHSMGLEVIAEGTETEAQVAELTTLGCELAQGFLYSRPVAAEHAFELLCHDYGQPKALCSLSSAATAG